MPPRGRLRRSHSPLSPASPSPDRRDSRSRSPRCEKNVYPSQSNNPSPDLRRGPDSRKSRYSSSRHVPLSRSLSPTPSWSDRREGARTGRGRKASEVSDSSEGEVSQVRRRRRDRDRHALKPMPTDKRSTVPNSGVLAMLIRDQVKTNDRMDRDELQKATVALNQIDRSGRQVRLMTEFLTGNDKK
eukprot:GHVN01006911.1.p1 GENE.GHVN01006911.1~~GHVN01006911.1.p1  ORF type:complete len:186 (+),score=48.89 GHVN01006911.1:60-617(+)